MERKDLTGCKFIGNSGKEYLILAGCEGSEVVFEERCNEAPMLEFCCDAKIIGNQLQGSYHTGYAVTKDELYAAVEGSDQKDDVDVIVNDLKKRYFKVPTVFLRLVTKSYLKGKM